VPCRREFRAWRFSFEHEPDAADEPDRVSARVFGEDSTVVELADCADALVQRHGDPTADLHHRVGGGKICATEAHTGYFALVRLAGRTDHQLYEWRRTGVRVSRPAHAAAEGRECRCRFDGRGLKLRVSASLVNGGLLSYRKSGLHGYSNSDRRGNGHKSVRTLTM
jgi:hypothetical protein